MALSELLNENTTLTELNLWGMSNPRSFFLLFQKQLLKETHLELKEQRVLVNR